MVGGQVMIIFVGGRALQVTKLNGPQWGYSILLGALSMPIGVIIRLIPDAFMARILPNIMQRRKTPQVVVTDEDHRYEWNPAIEGIRDELSFLKKIRGGRLNAIKFKIKHRRDTLIPMGRSRSGSRSRSSSVPQTPTDTAAHDFGVNAPPPAHLANTPNSQTRRRTRSRSNSAFGPAAAMAGVVAGSIAGWSPIDRANAPGEPEGAGGDASTAPKLEGRGDLEAQEGVVVHPGTDPRDPVITSDTHDPSQPPPSQLSEARPAIDPRERERDTAGAGAGAAGGGVIGKL